MAALNKGRVGTSRIMLDVSSNRLSGNIPETIREQKHISLLSGNYFECNSDGKDLPTHDPAHSTFMCMNNSNPVFAYILYAGIIMLFAFAVKGRATYSFYYHTFKMWLNVATNPEVLDDVHHPYVKRYSNYHQTLRWIVLRFGSVLTIVMVIAYAILSGESVRSVSNMKAGWSFTAAHLTGMGPTGLLLFVGLSLMLLTWYFLVAQRLPTQLTSLVQVSLNMITCQKEAEVKAVTDGVAEPVVETHCIFSCDAGKGPGDENHDFVLKVKEELKKLGAQTWVAEEHVVGDRREQVMSGIEHTQVAIVFISASYRDKVNQTDDKDICRYEFANAVEHIGPSYMIPVVIDPSMRNPRDWKGELGAALGRQLYVDLTDHSEANMQARVKDIFVGLNEMVANKTGSPIIVQTQYIRGLLRLLALMIIIWGVLIAGNITYVHVYLEHPHMFELYGILFAAFNLFWTMCVTPLLFNSQILRFGAKERLQSAFVQSKVQLKLTFNAVSAILIPLVCIMAMSPKCFNEAIDAGTTVTQEFTVKFGAVEHPAMDPLAPCTLYSTVLDANSAPIGDCLLMGERTFSTTFKDPFVYNATCASEILKSYAPLYQFMFILLLVRSALQLRYLIRDIDQTESGIPTLGSSTCQTCWLRFVEAILRLPSTHLMKTSSERKSMHSSESVFSTVRKDWVMDGIASSMSHTLILFTFGPFVPLLCLLATAAIALDSLVAELVFGRFLSTELGVVLESRRDVEANAFESDTQAAAVAFSEEKRAHLHQDITDVHEDWGALLALQDVDMACQKCLPLSTLSLAQHHLLLVPSVFFGLQLTDIISKDYSSQFWPFYVVVGLTLLFELHVIFVFPKLLKKHGEDDSAYRIKVEVILKPQPKSSAISRNVVPTLVEPPPDTHCFLTHDWGKGAENHRFVSTINAGLKKLGAITWFDEEQMKGNVRTKMVEGIEHTKVVIVFITSNYRDKVNQTDDRDNCRYEYTYAVEQIGPSYMIPVVLEESMLHPRNWKGELGAALGRQVFVDLSDHREENVAVKVKEIFAILNEMVEFKTGSPIIPIEVLSDAAPTMLKDIPKVSE